MNFTSYSVQDVLNQSLDPKLCRKILQEVQSPLVELSVMTNDSSISNSFLNAPKRPNIPNVQSYYQQNIKSVNYQSNNRQNYYGDYKQQRKSQKQQPFASNYSFPQKAESKVLNRNQQAQKIQNQSLVQILEAVSPLDLNVACSKGLKKSFIETIWQNLCGKIENFSFQSNHEIKCNENPLRLERKKIFDFEAENNSKRIKSHSKNKKEFSILLRNPNQQYSHISVLSQQESKVVQNSVKQTVQRLRQNEHLQIADFIQAITSVINLLKSAEKERIFLVQNIQMIHQLIQTSTNPFDGLVETNQNSDNFFARIKCLSVSDFIYKLSKAKLIQNSKFNLKKYNQQKNKTIDSLNTLIKAFSQIESLVKDFMAKQNSIRSLQIVYAILKEKFTKFTTKSSLDQIVNLFHDVKIFSYQKEACHLEYLWDDFSKKILSQNEFINDFAKANGYYKENKQQTINEGFEQQLLKMGFTPN